MVVSRNAQVLDPALQCHPIQTLLPGQLPQVPPGGAQHLPGRHHVAGRLGGQDLRQLHSLGLYELLDTVFLVIYPLLVLLIGSHSLGGGQGKFDTLTAGEDPKEGIVVQRRDGIEFVIVAASAATGQPQKSPGCDIDPVVLMTGLLAPQPSGPR